MSHFVITPNLIAGGNVTAASFVKLDTGNDLNGLLAGLGDQAIGISGPGGENLPISGGPTNYHAIATEPITAYGQGSYVPLTAGSAGWTRGWVKPDASGFGISANPGDVAGAYAFMSAATGEVRNVLVTGPVIVPATSGAGTIVTATVSQALTPAQAGSKVFIPLAASVVTLPPVATSKGAIFDFFLNSAAATYTGGASPVTIKINAADTSTAAVYATSITSPTAGKGIMDTKATTAQGDTVSLVCDGANWFARTYTGTWVRET
jgi:hypothetical protein